MSGTSLAKIAPDQQTLKIRRDSLQTLFTENTRAVAQSICDGLSKASPVERRNVSFAMIFGHVVKIRMTTLSHMFVSNYAMSIERATEGDLEEAIQSSKDYDTRVSLRNLLAQLREADAPREPLEIKIVNASELNPEKAVYVKRGDDGKISGAVVTHIPGDET